MDPVAKGQWCGARAVDSVHVCSPITSRLSRGAHAAAETALRMNLGPLDVFPIWVTALLIAAVLLGACELGYRLARRRGDAEKSDEGHVLSAMLALLGLLVGFTFSISVNPDATIRVASENHSRGISRGKQSQRQQSMALTTAEKGRRLLLPDEVRRLERDDELLFVKAQAPILAERVSYLRDQPFASRAEPNPLYMPDGRPPVSERVP